MAYIIPSDISRLALSGVHRPELQTLLILKAGLPSEYTVFHGVHWTREYQGWTHFGEIDFVVLNRSGDLLFIEQKNGMLREDGGDLLKDYQDVTKSPTDQILRSIGKYVRNLNGFMDNKDLCKLIILCIFLIIESKT